MSEFSHLPKTRAEAKAVGAKHYFTGRACKNGHLQKRLTSCAVCVDCGNEFSKSEQRKEYMRRYKKTPEQRSMARKYYKRVSVTEKFKKKNMDNVRRQREGNPSYIAWRKKYIREYNLKKSREDEAYRMASIMRAMTRRVLKLSGKKKESKTEDLVGYKKSDLVDHLESQFDKNMSWDNFGSYWQIDHIIPVSKLISDGETNPRKINCLSNLRPLKKEDNLSKSNRLEFLL